MTYRYRQLCVFYIIASNVQTDLSPTLATDIAPIVRIDSVRMRGIFHITFSITIVGQVIQSFIFHELLMNC